ncbi:MAG: hypothetical protein D6674_05540 [Acidobacteria bacterium]|jgi:hypothetical protein|nr:MAG: hypothetical protein D6674_05540 [Acidobacteriota bacterium]
MQVVITTNIPTPPNNSTAPHGAITFSVNLVQGQTSITVNITLPSIPQGAQFYKLINNQYVPFTLQINGNTISFTVLDNGQFDINPATGVITDPVVMVVSQQQPSGDGGCHVGAVHAL